MNLEALRNKLLAAARMQTPADHVPLAFEKRIMARLQHASAPDVVGLWAGALWRAVAPCLAVAIAISVWAVSSGEPANNATTTTAVESANLSQHFEQAMLADVGEPNEEAW